MNETAITKTQDYRLALEPRNFIEVRSIAQMAAKVGMCGVKNEEEGVLRILFGREMGFTAAQALRLVHVINGRPCVDATAIVGRVMQHPDCEYFELVESTATKATWKTKRKGRPEKELSWTIEQARNAKLDAKDNWRMWPENMLRARCASNLARIVWPEVTAGLYTADEVSHGVFEIRDGEVVHVEPPAEEPLVVKAEVVIERTPADVAMDFVKEIEQCTNITDLQVIGSRMREHDKLPQTLKKALNTAYTTQKKKIEAAAQPTQPEMPSQDEGS